MTVTERATQMVIDYGETIAINIVEVIREELLKQFNMHYPDSAAGYWCNSEESKFWTEVKAVIEKTEAAHPETSERWEKDYVAP